MICRSAPPRRQRAGLWLAAAALVAAIGLSGCNTEGIQISAKHLMPLSAEMTALLEKKGMSKDAPILIRAFKEESELEVWKKDATGQFALLKIYPICRWSGELGPKKKTGDRQAPEGFYTITPAQMNPNSQYYLSFNLGFPNAYDRAHGYTGSHLMVHGNCSSAGCYSMTDQQIGEIFALGREAFFGGQKQFQVQAYPFRMTALNMAKHRNSPHMAFWRMLKEGNDHFEVTRQQPKVDVCEKRYVFDAEDPANMSRPLRFEPAGRCPAYQVPSEVAQAVAAKTRRDEAEFAALVRRGTPVAPIVTGRDGGMHPTFMAKLNPQTITDAKGNVRWVVENPPMNMSIGAIQPPSDDASDLRLPPKLASADPQAATATAAAEGAARAPVTAASVPMPRPVPNRAPAVAAAPPASVAADAAGEARPAGAGGSGNLFNGLFTSPGKDTGLAFARALGFGKDETTASTRTQAAPQPLAVPPAPAAAPRPVPRAHTPRPVQVARPAPAATATAAIAPEARRPAAASEDAKAKLEAHAQPPQRQTAQGPTPAAPRPAAAAGLMSGAQPVIPAGSFENRWPAGFR